MIKIIKSGEFWFSSIWGQNDSLEGIYYSEAGETKTKNIFIKKDQYKICSFSSIRALRNPLMWAHYANGLKGVAVEIKPDTNQSDLEIIPVTYPKKITDHIIYNKESSEEDLVREIITTKEKYWKYEKEWRFLKKSQTASNLCVGKVTSIYIGVPFNKIDNQVDIYAACEKLKLYRSYLEKVILTAQKHQIKIHEVSLGRKLSQYSKNIYIEKISHAQMLEKLSTLNRRQRNKC